MSQITIEEFNQILKEELPWAEDNDMILEHISNGEAVMRLPYHHRSTRPGGSISGHI